MKDKKKVKIQYYLINTVIVILSLVAIFAFNAKNLKLGYICLALVIVFFIIMRIWAKSVSKKYFNGKNPISWTEIINIDK